MALLAVTLTVVTTLAIQSGACATPLATLRAAAAAPNLAPAATAPVAILPPAPVTAEPPHTEASSGRPRSLGQFVEETFAAVAAGFERSSNK